MAQRIVTGPRQRVLHRQLLGMREFDALSQAAQDDIVRLDAPTRRLLKDVWEPEGAEMDAAFGTATHLEPLDGNVMFDFEAKMHAARPDVFFSGLFSADRTAVEVGRGTWRMLVEGFDRYGNLAGDLHVIRGDITDPAQEDIIIPADGFDLDLLVASVLAPSGGTGGNFIQVQAKGKWAANCAFPLGTDALVVDLWVTIEGDETLMDRLSMQDVLTGTSATSVKCTATNYVRKVAGAVTFAYNYSPGFNNITGDFGDVTWSALGTVGGANQTLVKLSTAYRPASGSAESAIIPQSWHTFDATTDGTDMIASVSNFAIAN